MKQLVLVRHAKSDWSDPSLDDHDRPLNGRGQANALMMAERFAARGINVARIVSSTAVRARTTAAEFARATGLEVELDATLYMSTAKTLLARAASSGEASIMLVAHDPGITVLANELSASGIQHMPTCAIATFEWATPRTDVTSYPSDAWVADAWALDTVRSGSARSTQS